MKQIILQNIRKEYSNKVIFEEVNLKVQSGTVTTFVGHNGCGKSTLLKIIAGLVEKDAGEILCDAGYRFSFVPEKFPAVNLTARQFLRQMAAIDGGMSRGEAERKIDLLASDFFLKEMLDTNMRKLSKGTLQKVGVIQALMCEPDVLLLDEPLSGQDMDSQAVFIQKVLEQKKAGKIILMSCHEQELVDAVSDAVYTIRDERLVPYERTIRENYTIVVRGDDRAATEDMEVQGEYYLVHAQTGELPEKIAKLQREGWRISKIYESD